MVDGHWDPVLFAIPFFFLAIWWEMRAIGAQRRQGKPRAGFFRADSRASLLMGTVSLLTVGLVNVAGYFIAHWLFDHRIADLGSSAAGWIVAVVGWDFIYYWHHRWQHEIRVLWACHVNHHSSERYNLTTALRQPWFPIDGILQFPLLAVLGIPPWLIATSGSINLIYQFWVHTEAIDRMPRWFEWLLNTPSHHRVHHGSNPEYLDTNYAGILMIWDRLFRTFTPEVAPVEYGLTKNINSYRLRTIAFHEYAAVGHDVRTAPTLRLKLRAAFGRPGAFASALPDRS
ncbi:MAG: sterol desaturase family protein [Opitutaceae bacterium]|nr:sterol desaturase family protein [Opitutaceae bacterium]